jgi:redox-regulated HSP33 family molecular chaperone
MSNENETKDSNSKFTLGLVIGFLAGTTSYFLFNSEEGKELRVKLKDGWKEAKQNLPQIEQIELGDIRLEQLFDVILGEKDWEDLDPQDPHKPLLRSTTRRKKKKKKPQKFTGV